MLRLKQEHFDAFAREAQSEFEEEMVAHLYQSFGDVCRPMGEEGVRALIKRGIDDAEGHGITSRRGVCKYLNLAVVFGADFDTREAWAKLILEDGSINDPDMRAEKLAKAGVLAIEGEERGE